jgi:hypothetical protein
MRGDAGWPRKRRRGRPTYPKTRRGTPTSHRWERATVQWGAVSEVRPALLLDVDGVLNPYAAAERPPGYDEHRYQPGLLWGPRGLRVWLHRGHGPMLVEFAEEHGLELVWATTWEHQANEWIAPRIGLREELPVIEFGQGVVVKRPAVQRWAEDRPFAWIDDSFTVHDLRWADERGATLLVPIRPEVGLRDSDLPQVAEWVAAL